MKKVLFVEDHPDMLEILAWQMEMMGFSVIPARYGTEGEEKPQIILNPFNLFQFGFWRDREASGSIHRSAGFS
jgi:hypothetical protein